MNEAPRWRVGIDVGGTNTDAVVVDDRGDVQALAKRPTTADVTGGIVEALDEVLRQSGARDRIGHVMLGTTHCTNAVVARRGLTPVGVLRIGAPASTAVPPLTDWPPDLAAALDPVVAVVRGGFEFDGTEIMPLDEAAVEAFAARLDPGRAVAVVSIFSPVSARHEERAAAIIRAVAGDDRPISLSSAIGTVGLLERENATVLNAALTATIARAVAGFQEAMAALGLEARSYLSQNDGTLMDWERARRFPIFTIASGPTNSLRGAAYLTGLEDALVVDVGGTTTDVGALTRGFPRESALAVEIGGVRTNFRMPDLVSVGIGGGSRLHREADGTFRVGPDSVGFRLSQEALVFGGQTATLSDAAVRLGRVDMGRRSRVEAMPIETARAAVQAAEAQIAAAVDRMRTSAAPLPAIAVGGGAFLVPEGLPGAQAVLRPRYSEVANAIGAAIAQVSGEVDRVYSLADTPRAEVLDQAQREARAKAVAAGADAEAVTVVEVEELPLAYLPGSATRVRVKAVGPLSMASGLRSGKEPGVHA
jgi:N-methylhydantoinase A/oxoprolinase/acetone carboxylase beta subunit